MVKIIHCRGCSRFYDGEEYEKCPYCKTPWSGVLKEERAYREDGDARGNVFGRERRNTAANTGSIGETMNVRTGHDIENYSVLPANIEGDLPDSETVTASAAAFGGKQISSGTDSRSAAPSELSQRFEQILEQQRIRAEREAYAHRHTNTNSRALPAGTLLHGRYLIQEVLGSGGFGITYKALDQQFGVPKAIKEYFQQGVCSRVADDPKVLLISPAFSKRFAFGKARLLREAQVVAQFKSPNIVRVNDFFEENNTAYMVMEYLPYHDLQYYIREKKAMELPQILDIGVKICAALEEIHSFGVLHRDIAPDNIILDAENDVKLIDFGSARLPDAEEKDLLVAFKPGYAPPEQYEESVGRELFDANAGKRSSRSPEKNLQGPWTDVYAIGATLYALTTGSRPLEALVRAHDMEAGQPDPVAYPHTINSDIPEDISNAIMKAMALRAHERFRDVRELEAALRMDVHTEPMEVIRARRQRRRRWTIAASLLAAGGIFLLGGYIYQSKRADFTFLAPADVTIWYAREDSADSRAEELALAEICQELLNSDRYDNVSISLEGIPEAEYRQRLEEAYAKGQLPTIYECQSADVPVWAEGEIVSTGMQIPVLFVRYNLLEEQGMEELTSITGTEELLALAEDYPIAVHPALTGDYETMLPGLAEEGILLTDPEAFRNQEAALYLTDTRDLDQLLKENPAEYVVLPIRTEQILCSYTDGWVLTVDETAEEAVGKANTSVEEAAGKANTSAEEAVGKANMSADKAEDKTAGNTAEKTADKTAEKTAGEDILRFFGSEYAGICLYVSSDTGIQAGDPVAEQGRKSDVLASDLSDAGENSAGESRSGLPLNQEAMEELIRNRPVYGKIFDADCQYVLQSIR